VAWDVIPSASVTCPNCPFTLEWAFDVDYVPSSATDLTGCDVSLWPD
jgi:hypothetical protein